MFKFSQQQDQQQQTNVKKYEKGTVIVTEGASLSEMYILLQGSADVYKNYQKFNQADVESLKLGGFFGEMSLFLNQEAPGSLVATSDATMMTLDEKNYSEIFAKQPELAFSIIARMCRKLDAANKKLDRFDNKAKGSDAPDNTVPHGSALFPQGHGSYDLPMSNENTEYVYKQNCVCPMCGAKFESLSVLSSRLRRESTDKDLRVHYAGIEPMYYDIVSCPTCLYSAPTDLFATASKKFSEQLSGELSQFLPGVKIKTGAQRDSFTVFAGYYLALRCVALCFDEYQLTLGGLWQKLSRIYKDCADEKMYMLASENALKNYEYVYQNFYISEKQSQQVCYIVGDLYERLKNYDKARNYFFLAKSNREGTPAMKMQADKRLDEVKELIKQQ